MIMHLMRCVDNQLLFLVARVVCVIVGVEYVKKEQAENSCDIIT